MYSYPAAFSSREKRASLSISSDKLGSPSAQCERLRLFKAEMGTPGRDDFYEVVRFGRS
jgi:hypothetical protein